MDRYCSNTTDPKLLFDPQIVRFTMKLNDFCIFFKIVRIYYIDLRLRWCHLRLFLIFVYHAKEDTSWETMKMASTFFTNFLLWVEQKKYSSQENILFWYFDLKKQFICYFGLKFTKTAAWYLVYGLVNLFDIINFILYYCITKMY